MGNVTDTIPVPGLVTGDRRGEATLTLVRFSGRTYRMSPALDLVIIGQQNIELQINYHNSKILLILGNEILKSLISLI